MSEREMVFFCFGYDGGGVPSFFFKLISLIVPRKALLTGGEITMRFYFPNLLALTPLFISSELKTKWISVS